MKYEALTLEDAYKFQDLIELVCDGDKKEITLVPTEKLYQTMEVITNVWDALKPVLGEVFRNVGQAYINFGNSLIGIKKEQKEVEKCTE